MDIMYQQIPDELMAEAYETVGEHGRALIKREIARLFSFFSSKRGVKSKQNYDPQTGQVLDLSRQPVQELNVSIGMDYASFPRLLATVVPALSCGTQEMHVFLPDWKRISPWILAALELSGVEDIYCPSSAGEAAESVSPADFSGFWINLGRSSDSVNSGSSQCWCEPAVLKAGVWMESPGCFDIRAIKRHHPDMEFNIYSPGKMENAQVISVERFVGLDHDVVYAPEYLLPECSRAWLGLGPGMELAWLWPGILDFIRRPSARLTCKKTLRESKWTDPL